MCRLFLRTMILAMVAVFWAIGHAAGGDSTDSNPARHEPGLTPIFSGNSGATSSSTTNKGTRGLAKSNVTAKLKPVEESLSPIPDPQQGAPVAIDPASFKGIVPGTSTKDDVADAWGPPRKIAKADGELIHLYSVEPFKQVEVHFAGDKVASIVIRLERSFPADAVAKQLGLGGIRAVLVSNDVGEVLGQAFPERGVMFAAAPGDDSKKDGMNISQIILEAISAEPFVLRAETTLETRPDLSRRDLEDATKLEPTNARAHWLLSRLWTAAERPEKAEREAAEAVRLEPGNAQYRTTHAKTLAELGRFDEATGEAQKAVDAHGRPHVQARATCLLGDLAASGADPDFKKALGLHTKAIQLADPLASDPHPAIRVAAKEVLVDAHLSAAHDIAWGQWQDKPKAVKMWLEQAVAAADDLVKNEGVGQERLFHVHARALAAYVGLRGEIDPEPTVAKATEVGEKLIADARTAQQKSQYQAELGAALYDAVQTCQMRNDAKNAIRYGEAAAKQLAAANQASPSSPTAFLLGRLYFRLGTIHAMQDGNHKEAVVWFNKAIPLLERAAADELESDPGRFGESFVGMGVSYWESGQREKGVALTQKGIQWMEQAVKQGAMDRASLGVAYGNLAAMHRKLGDNGQADRYQQMASRATNDKVK